ncbi:MULTISPECIES: response regulator transcription factor [unclassified Spirosoma]|uniref:LuxR family transcriptional regulator n=1 Tax=unclassified Spirosoma TaxID=2621999 RepID=UPI000959ECAF|nr:MULTISPECIES: response regulator transcription factor [unclassified Spirosoma]MBN8824784.1 response regulator transcription factor [Spirosoma sp.]OJW77063.1 MAG: LuxR family transcriptional regulator [Spirosoma sp. 48-14]
MNQSTGVQEGTKNFAIRRRDFSILVAQSELFNCEVLSQLLREQGYNVVGRAVEMEDTLQQIRVKRPKCVIVESEISGQGSLDIVEQTRSANQQTRFILYTRKPDLRTIAYAMQKGFFGFLYASDGLDELYRCFQTVSNGGCYYSNGFMDLLRNFGVNVISDDTREELNRLTDREREVLRMIASGDTCADIAERLNISYRTAVNHKAHIARKLNLKSCRELPRYGISVKNYL